MPHRRFIQVVTTRFDAAQSKCESYSEMHESHATAPSATGQPASVLEMTTSVTV